MQVGNRAQMKFACLGTLSVTGALAALMVAAPASAGEVYAAGNGLTGQVAVAGNAADSGDWLRRNTIERGQDGWVQILGGDDPGWAAVSCSRHDNGQYNFQIAKGQPSESEARRLARAATEQHLSRSEIAGKLLPNCGYAWNNVNQPITLGPSAANPEKPVNQAKAPASAAAPAKQKPGAGKLSSTPIDAPINPILINSKTLGSQQNQPTPPSEQIGQARLPCRIVGHEVVVPLDTNCAKTNGAAQERSAKGGKGSQPRSASPPPRPGTELHLEAVTVCEFVEPWARTGQWTCRGTVGTSYVNFDKANWHTQLKMAGGSKTGAPPRDLGMVGRFRVFGWQYPLTAHPDRNWDVALRMGVPEIPTRLRYWCPKGTSANCTVQ